MPTHYSIQPEDIGPQPKRTPHLKEEYSRVLINEKLKDAGWDITDPNRVIFEDHGIAGRADYILKDKHGNPVALIEAKAPSIDPYTAKQQALNYAETQYKGKLDYIYLANDHIIYLWDFIAGGDAYPVNDFFTQEDLSRKRQARVSANCEPLRQKPVEENYFSDVAPDIKLRPYQIEAWRNVAIAYDSGKRKFLLEMATGTGKTVLAALIISKFLRTNQAQNILFVVDRVELAGQTKGVFEKLLGNLSAVGTYWGASKKNLVGANVVVATIQSLIAHGRQVFTPGYFDLIIHDEAHRSIYSAEARGIMDYFVGASSIGLTATPKDFLKNIDVNKLSVDDPRAIEIRLQRDTYKFFDCDKGQATYRYTIQDGVKDEFLVPPKLHKMTSILTQEALSPNGLSGEGDYEDENYQLEDLEKNVFVPERNKLMMQEFLEYAEKTPTGEIGKTIIFAVNQNHALALEKILNSLEPAYNGRFARTITSRVQGAHELARDFKKIDNKLPRIAVSVDMLTTGYDAPEVQNIVLARPVFEPTLYQQIKGRGTRLCQEINKDHFVIFDFCGVCQYFEEKYDWEAPLKVPRPAGKKSTSASTTEGQISEPIISLEKFEQPIIHRSDLVATRDQIVYGPAGDKVDSEMYQNEWTKMVKKFAEEMPEVEKIAEDEDKTEQLTGILDEKLLNKPEFYFNEDNLVKSHRVVATIRDFFLAALGKKKLPNREDQVKEWRQGMLEKYGRSSKGASQNRYLMAKLVIDQMIQNPVLRREVEEKQNLKFLLDEPFNQGFSTDEWLSTFGIEELSSIVYDVNNSKVLRVS